MAFSLKDIGLVLRKFANQGSGNSLMVFLIGVCIMWVCYGVWVIYMIKYYDG